jgi:hypothetical protein
MNALGKRQVAQVCRKSCKRFGRPACWRSGSKLRRSVLEGYTWRKRVNSSTVIDDNFDDSQADMERYVAGYTYRF